MVEEKILSSLQETRSFWNLQEDVTENLTRLKVMPPGVGAWGCIYSFKSDLRKVVEVNIVTNRNIRIFSKFESVWELMVAGTLVYSISQRGRGNSLSQWNSNKN